MTSAKLKLQLQLHRNNLPNSLYSILHPPPSQITLFQAPKAAKSPHTISFHQSTPKMSTTEEPPRLKIRTQHCRFCNHLLLATTRTLNTLPRRSGETKDKAIILPLEAQTQDPEVEDNSNANVSPNTKHTTLLLSTTLPDRRATLIRREDGIEKRILLRCGRCRVVMGYYLDKVHWGTSKRVEHNTEDGEENEEAQRPPAVYILPGAVVETEEMGEKDGGVGEMEWRTWGDV